MKPLTVQLPVCPACLRVGKLPPQDSRKDYCVGPVENTHRKARMVPRTFREVTEK